MNKVVLSPGRPIAKLLQTFGYTYFFVVEQVTNPVIAEQLANLMPAAQIVRERPHSDARGRCTGGRTCTTQILAMWERVRDADARIIVHEHGGADYEFFLLLGTD